MGALIKLMVGGIGVFLLGFAAAQAFRSARRLDRRVAQFKAEQREMEEQGRTIHPYAALGQLYVKDSRENDPRKIRSATKKRYKSSNPGKQL